VEKKKGEAALRCFASPNISTIKRYRKAALFSSSILPFLFGSRKRGFDSYISKYRTGSSPCVVLWTLFFFFSFVLSFFLCGARENRIETLRRKKEKKREQKKKQ